jgi:hypothetical protein
MSSCNAAHLPTLLGSGSFSPLACMYCNCSFVTFLSSVLSSQEIAKNNFPDKKKIESNSLKFCIHKSVSFVRKELQTIVYSFIKGLMLVI